MDNESKPLMGADDVEYAPSSSYSDDSLVNADGENKEFDEGRFIYSKA